MIIFRFYYFNNNNNNNNKNNNNNNNNVWRAVKKAQYPTLKEPAGLEMTDGKRPGGATFIPWTRSNSLAWDITVPDTYTRSYIYYTAGRATAAADRAAANKIAKDTELTTTHHHFDCNRDGRCYRICQRSRKKDYRGDERTTRDLVPFSETLNCVTERKCGRVQKYIHNRAVFFNHMHVISRAPTNLKCSSLRICASGR